MRVRGAATGGHTLLHWQLRQSFGCAMDVEHHLLPQSFFLSFLVWEIVRISAAESEQRERARTIT